MNPTHPADNNLRALFLSYASYVSFFLGMGLISGSIVHMPYDPARYSVLLGAGVIVFVVASLLTEVYVEKRALTVAGVLRSLFFSLLLSVGIGMMSGGIQHFEDNMVYSATLIPLGFSVSLFAFWFKHSIKLSTRQTVMAMLIFLAVVLPLWFGLDYVAHNMEIGGHGH